MSNSNFTNMSKQQYSICPTNGRQTVGDGAFTTDMTPSVIAVCHMEGTNSMYYYSTTFSGGPGVSLGGFDTPTTKCPPDRGSPDWVTDSLAPSTLPALSSSPTSSFASSNDSSDSTLSSIGPHIHPSLQTSFVAPPFDYPPTPPPEEASLGSSPEFSHAALPNVSAPRVIPQAHPQVRRTSSVAATGLATPPLTPDNRSEAGVGSLSALGAKQSAFLSVLFPRNALGAAQHAKSVSIATPGTGATFEGVVLSLPGKPKTFYVDGKYAATVNLRESIVALLDLADEQLGCNALVIVLERSSPALGDLLHSLMYVGGQVVTKPPFPTDPAYVLVGMEI
ncbi:ornithine decarboxylase antizyme-domain-containing protein [Dichomitus squalens]|uniref:Ornithine decarboxylase antizyme n=1 Tax=Dichomitus squalens TaxID=114155 RepID=A0A4V2K0N4_9APHY|nr:ornithine decarboxylase antizyme-domain-containing protein [Dichomitus squalens]